MGNYPLGAQTSQVKAHDEAHDEAYDEAYDEAHDEAHDLSATELAILNACLSAPQSTQELLHALGYRSRTGNFKKALSNLVNDIAALERTLPGAVRSKNQKYRLTPKGRTILEKHDES